MKGLFRFNIITCDDVHDALHDDDDGAQPPCDGGAIHDDDVLHDASDDVPAQMIEY